MLFVSALRSWKFVRVSLESALSCSMLSLISLTSRLDRGKKKELASLLGGHKAHMRSCHVRRVGRQSQGNGTLVLPQLIQQPLCLVLFEEPAKRGDKRLSLGLSGEDGLRGQEILQLRQNPPAAHDGPVVSAECGQDGRVAAAGHEQLELVQDGPQRRDLDEDEAELAGSVLDGGKELLAQDDEPVRGMDDGNDVGGGADGIHLGSTSVLAVVVATLRGEPAAGARAEEAWADTR